MKPIHILPGLMSLALPVAAADVTATLQWSQRVELSTPVSGVVQKVNAGVGSRVAKGQPLLTLDTAGFQAQVAESQAVVTRHKEERDEAKRNLDRVEELYKRQTLATAELEVAQTRHARANAHLNESQAHLRRVQKLLGDATLRAPFDGWVVARQVEPGQVVASQLQPQTLFVLARAGEMVARGKVSLAQVDKLKVGDEISVAVNQQSYRGKIKLLGLEPVGDKDGVGYPIEVQFPIKELLRAGTPATIKLP